MDEPNDERLIINAEDLESEDAGEAAPPAAQQPASAGRLVITSEDLADEGPGPATRHRLKTTGGIPRRLARASRPVGRHGWGRFRPKWRLSLWITAGSLSAAGAWALSAPLLRGPNPPVWAGMLLFAALAGCMGFGLGALEGLRARDLVRALRAGAVAFAIGAAGGFIAAAVSPTWMYQVVVQTPLVDARSVLSRTVAWAGLGALVGLAQGVPHGSKWKIRRGLLGGVGGGAIAGLLLYPLAAWTGVLSAFRLVGLATTGGLTGLGVGLGQHVRRPAWLVVTRGLLAECEFVLHRPSMAIGADRDCDIPLRGDPAVSLRHAVIRTTPAGFVIEDLGSTTGTFVNGTLVRRQRLRNQDAIGVGATLMIYRERDLSPVGVSYHGAVGTF